MVKNMKNMKNMVKEYESIKAIVTKLREAGG